MQIIVQGLLRKALAKLLLYSSVSVVVVFLFVKDEIQRESEAGGAELIFQNPICKSFASQVFVMLLVLRCCFLLAFKQPSSFDSRLSFSMLGMSFSCL